MKTKPESLVLCTLKKDCPEFVTCKLRDHANRCMVYRACVEKKMPVYTEADRIDFKDKKKGRILRFRRAYPGLSKMDCANKLHLKISDVEKTWDELTPYVYRRSKKNVVRRNRPPKNIRKKRSSKKVNENPKLDIDNLVDSYPNAKILADYYREHPNATTKEMQDNLKMSCSTIIRWKARCPKIKSS